MFGRRCRSKTNIAFTGIRSRLAICSIVSNDDAFDATLDQAEEIYRHPHALQIAPASAYAHDGLSGDNVQIVCGEKASRSGCTALHSCRNLATRTTE
jgi:hypothetical protein